MKDDATKYTGANLEFKSKSSSWTFVGVGSYIY